MHTDQDRCIICLKEAKPEQNFSSGQDRISNVELFSSHMPVYDGLPSKKTLIMHITKTDNILLEDF
jgi:hypothetical protein